MMFGMPDPLGPTAGVPGVVGVRGRGDFSCTSVNNFKQVDFCMTDYFALDFQTPQLLPLFWGYTPPVFQLRFQKGRVLEPKRHSATTKRAFGCGTL